MSDSPVPDPASVAAPEGPDVHTADSGTTSPVRRIRAHAAALSLRTRLLVAIGIVALVALVVSDVVTYSSLHSELFAQADQSLEAVHTPLEQLLDSGRALSPETVASLAPGMFVEVVNPQDQPVGTPVPAIVQGGQQYTPALTDADLTLPSPSPTTTTLFPAEGFPPFGQIVTPSTTEVVRYETVPDAQAGGPEFRVRVSSLIDGYELVLGTPVSSASSTLHRLFLIEVGVTLGALAGAIVIGFFLVRVGLRPLGDVEATAEAIAAGDMSRRVAGASATTEVGRLAGAFNTMVERIEEAFSVREATEAELRRSEERMRRFVADASHELRTPLAAVRAYAELFERGGREHPEDLERLLAGIRSESERMGLLVEDLMLLARLDNGRPLQRRPVELVPLCAAAIDAARLVGPGWPVTLDATEPVEAVGDPERLRQVIDNLLSNLRAHTPSGTRATVTVRRAGEWAVLEVSDNGPGLSPVDAERAFERFYRADVSRTRPPGVPSGGGPATGSGLGLSIVAAVVKALGGSVSASSNPEGGARFAMVIPAVQSESVGSGTGHGASEVADGVAPTAGRAYPENAQGILGGNTAG